MSRNESAKERALSQQRKSASENERYRARSFEEELRSRQKLKSTTPPRVEEIPALPLEAPEQFAPTNHLNFRRNFPHLLLLILYASQLIKYDKVEVIAKAPKDSGELDLADAEGKKDSHSSSLTDVKGSSENTKSHVYNSIGGVLAQAFETFNANSPTNSLEPIFAKSAEAPSQVATEISPQRREFNKFFKEKIRPLIVIEGADKMSKREVNKILCEFRNACYLSSREDFQLMDYFLNHISNIALKDAGGASYNPVRNLFTIQYYKAADGRIIVRSDMILHEAMHFLQFTNRNFKQVEPLENCSETLGALSGMAQACLTLNIFCDRVIEIAKSYEHRIDAVIMSGGEVGAKVKGNLLGVPIIYEVLRGGRAQIALDPDLEIAGVDKKMLNNIFKMVVAFNDNRVDYEKIVRGYREEFLANDPHIFDNKAVEKVFTESLISAEREAYMVQIIPGSVIRKYCPTLDQPQSRLDGDVEEDAIREKLIRAVITSEGAKKRIEGKFTHSAAKLVTKDFTRTIPS